MGSLEGKVAIVTGGGTGIGKGIARAFAEQGCNLVLAARNLDRLESAADELRKIPGAGKIVVSAVDVTKEQDVIDLFALTIREFNKLDILVNNSGSFDGGPIEKLTLEQWERVMGVNVTGPFLCTREAFKIMRPAGGGRIINIGSIAAQRPREQSIPYSTSKNAVWGLTTAAALEGRPFGIAVSCLHPGNVAVERRADGRSATGRDMGPEPLVSTADMGRTALLMATLPPETNMLEAIVLPVAQTYLGRG